MNFKSKFHFWKVYFTMTFGTLFFFGLGYAMFVIPLKPGDSKIMFFIFGIASILLGIYSIYTYIKQVPVIRISQKGVTLKSLLTNKQFNWNEVQSVKYTGKNTFKYIVGFSMEATLIHLTDKRQIKIFYEHYSNGYLIQQYLKSYHEHGNPPVLIEEKSVTSYELVGESFTNYMGAPLSSLRGIIVWGFILALFIIVIYNGITDINILPITILCIIWYLLWSLFSFYIQISSNYLVIKNYFIPFIGKKYRLTDIQEMVIEAQPNGANSLRVISNSFKYRIFLCGIIRDKEWKSFIKDVKTKGIKIRNESIY